MMAKKGMQFNSQAAKSKWAALEHGADHSIDNLVAGKASASDIQKIGQTLSAMSATASQVFTEAVDAAKQTVSAASWPNSDKVKGKGTEFDRALNQALKPLLTDVLESIRAIIDIESKQQSEDLQAFIGHSFDELHKRLPEDLPSAADLLAGHEAITDAIDTKDEDKDEQPLLERIFEKLTELGHTIQGFMKKDEAEDDFATQAQRFVESPEGEAAVTAAVAEGAESMALKSSATSGKATTVEGESEGTRLERQRQASLFDRLESFLDNQGGDARGKNSDVEEDKEEDKKADTWWKSFNKWVGKSIKDKGKKAKTGILDMLKDLGTVGLLTAIFDPQMWTQLADDMQKYLTWDNLKSAFFTSWDWLKDKTSGIVDWVLEKLGIGGKGTKPQAKLTPAAQAQMDQLSPTEQLKSVGGPQQQAALLMKETVDGKLTAKGQAMWQVASPETKKAYEEHKYDNETVTQTASRKAGDLVNASVDFVNKHPGVKSMLPSSWTGTSQRSTVTPSTAATTYNEGASNTTVNAPTNATPSTTVPAPGAALSGPGAGTNVPAPATQGAAPVGINSFGFTQGTSDNLLLMNSSILGH